MAYKPEKWYVPAISSKANKDEMMTIGIYFRMPFLLIYMLQFNTIPEKRQRPT
tara:strand:+ start:303 stop:461 length:159 start_codon:yes stop_codon:yes gene_type:complete